MTNVKWMDLDYNARMNDPRPKDPSKALWDIVDDEDNARPVIDACISGDKEALEELLSQEPVREALRETQGCIHPRYPLDPRWNERSVMAITNLSRAVWAATYNDHDAIVHALLKYMGDRKLQLDWYVNFRVITKALYGGAAAAIEALVRADPETINCKMIHYVTPLYEAVRLGRYSIAKVLLDAGADPHRPFERIAERLGYTSQYPSLLDMAAAYQRPELLQLLLKYDLPIPGSYALHRAASRGRFENTRILIERGADVNEVGPNGGYKYLPFKKATPLHYAFWSGRADIVDLLMAAGARSDLLDANGQTPAEVETREQWEERCEREREEERKREEADKAQS